MTVQSYRRRNALGAVRTTLANLIMLQRPTKE